MRTIYTPESLEGKKFNALTYIGDFHRDSQYKSFAKWKCDCGNEVVACVPDVVRGKKKSCNCFKFRRGSAHYKWGGCGEISGNLWYSIKSGAASRNLPCSVTIEDAWGLFLKQERKCALTGELLIFGNTSYSPDTTASLDRIDPSNGYVRGNVQWVHKTINRIKMDLQEPEFIEWCRRVSEFKC